MNTSLFWNQWNKPYKYFYWFLLFVFLFAISFLTYAWVFGHDVTVQWTTNTNMEPTLVGVYDFTRNYFSFSVPADTYLASDVYVPDTISINPVFAYISLSLLAIGFIWCISIVSFFELYWYMGGMLALFGFCIGLNLDILEIAGRTDKIPLIVVFAVYGGISYLFNAVWKNTSLWIRLLVFASITLVFILLIAQLAKVSNPFLFLAAYSSFVPLSITLFLVATQGYFVQKLFLYLVSSRQSSDSNSLSHFLIGSGLYILSLALLLLKKLNVLELNLVYLHPFFIFIFCSFAGIWLFRKQTELFGGNLPFVPAGALLYLSLVIMASTGISYSCITDNFGFIEAYERYMLYGYLFSGFVFVVYVLANFGHLFSTKVSIFAMVYQPIRMTFWTVPLITITMTIVFFAYQKKYPHHLSLSGFYTAAGDAYVNEGNIPLALEYYRNAVGYDFPNPRANYSIASLAHTLGDNTTSMGYYENALVRNPNPECFAGLANAYMEEGDYFKAVFKLQDGLKVFPENGYLLNNLGMAYSKTSVTDSTFYYLNKAAKTLSDDAIPHSNILYVLNKKGFGPLADSLSKVYSHNQISFEINRMATNLMNGVADQKELESKWIGKTGLNELQYAYFWNYTLLHPEFKAENPNKLQLDSNNLEFRDGLQYLQAWQLYRQDNALEAMTMLENLIAATVNNSAYARTLGYWMLEQDAYDEAERLFKLTLPAFQFDDALNLALVHMRLDKTRAIETLRGLAIHPDSLKRPVALAFLQMLNAEVQTVTSLPMGMQIYFCAVNQRELSDKQVLDLLLKMDAKSGATVWADRLEYLSSTDLKRAEQWYSQVPELQNEACYYAISNFAFLSGAPEILKTTIGKDWTRPRLKKYYQAYLLEKEGKQQEAALAYLSAFRTAPMYDGLYLPALNTINKAGKGEEGYAILVDAIRRRPESRAIQRAYLEQCLFMGYTNYADMTLKELKTVISSAEFQNYQQKLDSLNSNPL
jgi:predicted Zn-dependent protease